MPPQAPAPMPTQQPTYRTDPDTGQKYQWSDYDQDWKPSGAATPPKPKQTTYIEDFENWAHKTADSRQMEELRSAAKGDPHPIRAGIRSFAPNVLADLAKTYRSMATPLNVGLGATAAAFPPAAAPIAGGFMLAGGKQGYDAGKSMSEDGVTPENLQGMLTAGATIAGAGAMVKGGASDFAEKFSRAPKETSAQALSRFRSKTTANPGKWDLDVALKAHENEVDMVDKASTQLAEKLNKVPVDPGKVNKAMSQLAVENHPYIAQWMQQHLVEYAESQRAPTWQEIQALNKDLGRMDMDPKVPEGVRTKIPAARAELDKLEESAAEQSGVKDDYNKVKGGRKRLDDVLYHTAYVTEKIKPNQFWQPAGSAAGLAATSHMAMPGSSLAGVVMGGIGGQMAGRILTPEGYRVPTESLKGAHELWDFMGQKAPKGSFPRRIKMEAEPKRGSTPPSGSGGSTPQPGGQGGPKVGPQGGPKVGPLSRSERAEYQSQLKKNAPLREAGRVERAQKAGQIAQEKGSIAEERGGKTETEWKHQLRRDFTDGKISQAEYRLRLRRGSPINVSNREIDAMVNRAAKFKDRLKARTPEGKAQLEVNQRLMNEHSQQAKEDQARFRENNPGSNVTTSRKSHTPQVQSMTEQHSSNTPQGAQLETQIFKQVATENPGWDIGKIAMEAARRMNAMQKKP